MKSIRCACLLTFGTAAVLALGCGPEGPTETDTGTTPRRDAASGRDTGSNRDAGSNRDVPRQDSAGRDTLTRVDSSTPRDSAGGQDAAVAVVDTTIHAVQNNEVAAYTCVRLSAVVMSAVYGDRDDDYSPPDAGSVPHQAFYISEKNLTTTAARTGIQVVVTNIAAPSVVPGDDVIVVGQYSEYYDNSTIRLNASCGQVTKVASGLALPAAETLLIADIGQTGSASPWTDGAQAEAFEGVLVKITAGTVDVASDGHGSFQVTDGTAKLQINNMLGTTVAPAVNDTVQSITGFSAYSYERRKLRPRSNADILLTSTPIECGASSTTNHLLLSEIKIGPTAGEFVEIHNPTSASIDLSNYYLYNATYLGTADGGAAVTCYYYNIVTGAQCGIDNSDFSLRFPAGASIAAGAYQLVALTGAANFCNTYYSGATCTKPDYEIPASAGGDAAVADMRGSWDSSADIFTQFGFLTASREDLVLFSWNGSDPTVKDVDYFVWGTDTGVRTDKTGVSTYLADTPVASQSAPAGSIQASQSYQRACYNEGTEAETAGNGITNHNETSENLATTFVIREPSVGVRTVGAP